jgi:xylulokinase
MALDKKEKYVLAVDHGTSGCKVAIVTVHGKVIDFESEPTPIYFFPGGGAEQDPEEWWQAFMRASVRLLRRHRNKARRVEAVCVSSTFSSTVAVDRGGNIS